MDTRQLRHFRAVAETLHFGRAAEQLGMTQPPLSQSIIALERELGAPLFVRTKRQVALTPFGEQWLAHVKTALEELEGLPEIARQLRDGQTGRLAPGALVGAPGVIFPRRVAPAFYDLAIETLKSLTGGARIVQEAIQMQTIISLVSAGIGVALVPASLRHLARTGVCYLGLPGDGPYLESGLVWRADDATPTLRRFLDVALQPLA